MASARHRPIPRPSSSSRNPFDSSDDENDGPKRAPSSRDYVNPFEDEDAHGGSSKAKSGHGLTAPPPRSKPPSQAYTKNPFDDDEEEEEGVRDYGKKQGSLKAKLDQGTLFDEEPRFHGDLPERKSKSKSPATSALKKVQKFKDASTAQASKMVEGGMQQAQRLKESSFSAFKSGEGKAVQSGNEQNQPRADNAATSAHKRDAHDRRPGNPDDSMHARLQLLSEPPPSGLYKGAPRQYPPKTDFEKGSIGTRSPIRYDDHQFQGADIEQRTMQELEGYALQKSEDTTQRIQNCLKVAEDIKGDATRTLVSLHQQGEQLRRTHEVAHDIDQSLTSGEKLLGSLGGMFSRTWKPKRSSAIKGPVDDPKDFQIRRKGHHLEQRSALGLDSKAQTDQPSSYDISDSQEQTAEAKLKVERTKQDDALSDLSNVLDQLKEMSMDMGSEIARQNVALDNFQNDVVILDERVKGANVRGRRLLGK